MHGGLQLTPKPVGQPLAQATAAGRIQGSGRYRGYEYTAMTYATSRIVTLPSKATSHDRGVDARRSESTFAAVMQPAIGLLAALAKS